MNLFYILFSFVLSFCSRPLENKFIIPRRYFALELRGWYCASSRRHRATGGELLHTSARAIRGQVSRLGADVVQG